MSNDASTGMSVPPRAVRPRPRRISSERLRLRALRADEPAPNYHQVARYLGYFGLRPGPHATWARPLAPGSLVERISRARVRLKTGQRLRAIAADHADVKKTG